MTQFDNLIETFEESTSTDDTRPGKVWGDSDAITQAQAFVEAKGKEGFRLVSLSGTPESVVVALVRECT
jgi:hypothetical protein